LATAKSTFSSAEAQAAAIADDIAYDAHDIDDGLRAGLLDVQRLAEVPFLAEIMAAIEREHPGCAGTRRINEIVRRVITRLIEDVIDEALRRLAALRPDSAADIRHAGRPVIAFSDAAAAADRELKAYLKKNVYRHEKVMRVMRSAEDVVKQLFERYWRDPAALPDGWRADGSGLDERRRARAIADFLAGMTDRYALREYQRLFDASADLG